MAVGVGAASALVGQRLAGPSSAVSQARTTLRFPAPRSPPRRCRPARTCSIPGLSPFITPNGSFYRVDTAIILPEVDPASWQLRIHGMVAREITLTFADLLRLPLIEDYITLCCVSNPVGRPLYRQRASGWERAWPACSVRPGSGPGPSQLLCTSVGRVHLRYPGADGHGRPGRAAGGGDERAPLPVAHGFPARLVVPGLYGYVSACKWVTDINVTTFAYAQAYWVPRGWSQQAPIKTESRIDVPNGSATLTRGPHPGRRRGLGAAQGHRRGGGAR